MPKKDIDYSNTIIYKIVCKDESIKDLYVGHTTNFVQRKYQHKQASSDIHNNCKLYKTVRSNGGWDNWTMEIINFFNCENSYEARKKEQEYYESLNATLNTVSPLPNTLKISNSKNDMINVIEDPNNNCISIIECNQQPSEIFKYECKSCNFICNKKYNFIRHLSTDKHLQVSKKKKKQHDYICVCKKKYNTQSGLWKHKQKCSEKKIGEISPLVLDKETIIMILQQNSEFKDVILEQSKQIIELSKNSNNNSITLNTTNNNNQSFNMNLFLNEQCKDAINIGEFVNTLPLKLEDLENTGKVGYVKGITDIVVRGLKEMDVHKRPIHCSDLKREVIYVKDNDVWQKDEDNVKVKKAIQTIGTRNYRQVKEWIEKYPEAKDNHSKKHEEYVQIRLKCTGGSDSAEDDKMQNKILTSIAKVVHIDK